MEDVNKSLKKATENLKKATDAVMELQQNDDELGTIVLSNDKDRIYSARNGTDFAIAALLANAMREDDQLLTIVKVAVECVEDMAKKCDA